MNARLTQGQTLPCGCVVGFYWCSPHDIYAKRSKDESVWGFGHDGSFVMRTRKANAHRPESDFHPIHSARHDSDYDPKPSDRGCSCHLSAPCSYCTDGGYCKEHDAMRNDCGCEL